MPHGAEMGPQHRLGVKMGVVIDKAWRDDPSRRIDRPLGGGAVRLADADDFALMHRDIGLERRLARAVDDVPVLDEQIIGHDFYLPLPRSARAQRPPSSSWAFPPVLFCLDRPARL